MPFRLARFGLTAASLTLILTACGGGDAQAPAASPAVPAAVVPAVPAANAPPVAVAGSAQSAFVGALVTLDASQSTDADSDALTYKWALDSKPAGSLAVLSSTTALKPTFTADMAGEYVVSLVVNDGKADSVAAQVKVTAAVRNLVVNGSFENGLASWSFAGVQQSGVNPACSYNAAVAPGAETASGQPGFPATEGAQVALGSASTDSGYFSCVLYQDVAIPADVNGLTFSFDIGNRYIGSGGPCLFIGLYPTGAVPGYPDAVVGGQRTLYCQTGDTALTAKTLTYSTSDIQAIKGTIVRVAFINAMVGPGTGIIGVDNVRIALAP